MIPPHQRRSPGRRRRIIQWMFLVAVVLVGVRALLPPALERGGEYFASRSLGRIVEIDNVDLALHRGGLRVDGVRIGGPRPAEGESAPVAPEAAIASVASLAGELDWWSLARGELRLRLVEVVTPVLRLEQASDGTLTEFVLVESAPEPETEAGDDASGGWPLLLDLFALRDAELILRSPERDEIDFRLAELSLSDFSLRDGQLALGHIDLREPQLRVHREVAMGERPIRTKADPTDAEQTTAPPDAAPTAGTPAPPAPGPRIRNIDIDRAAFTLLTDDVSLDIVLGFSASDVTIDAGESFPATLRIEMAGGSLELDGRVGAAPPRFEGRLEWSDIGFPVVTRALGLELPIRVDSVVSSGGLDVVADLGAGETGEVRLAGELGVRDLEAVVRATEEHLTARSLDLAVGEFEMALPDASGAAPPARFQGGLHAAQIHFENPTSGVAGEVARVTIDEVAASIPVSPGGELHLAGAFRIDAIGAQTGTGDRVRIEAIQISLRDLGAPTGDAQGDASGAAFEIDASATATGLELESPHAGVAARIAELGLSGAAATLPVSGAPELVVEAIELNRPQIALTRRATTPADGAQSEAAPAGEDAAPTPQPRARVARFDLREGSVELTDEVVEPRSQSRIVGIQMAVREIEWPERTVGHFEYRSRGPAGAALHASGRLGASSQIELALDSLGLSHFNPYAAPSGYQIDRGDAGLQGEVSLTGEQLEVDTKLVLDQLDLASGGGEGFEAEFGMPVGLAVALLKDPSGRISLPIGFTADRGELDTKLVPLVTATLRQALVGAVTLPLKAVKGLVPGGGREADLDLPMVAAAPGQIAPTPEASAEIAAVAELLVERPQLGLRVQGHAGPEDREPLARVLLAEQVQAGEALPEAVEVSFFARRRLRKALEEQGAQAHEVLAEEDRALLDEVVAAVEVPPDRYRALAEARGAALRDALVTEYGVEAERIELAQVGSAQAPGAQPELVAANTLGRGAVAETQPAPPVAAGPPAATAEETR